MPRPGAKVNKKPALFIDSLDVFEPAQTKAFTVNVEDMSLVKEPVEDGRGGHLIVCEDVGPFFDRAVTGDDGAALYISGRDELEEQVRLTTIQRLVAEFIDDHQGILDVSPSTLVVDRDVTTFLELHQ